MNNKNKFFATGTALAYLLLLPSVSVSHTIGNVDKHSGLYISGQYKPTFSHFSNFSVKETNFPTKQLVGLKKDVDSTAISAGTTASGISKAENFNFPYIAEFQDDTTSFGGAIGYFSSEGIRFEIEGSYEKFDVKNPGNCATKDSYRYFALAREMNGTANTFQPKAESSTNSAYHTVMRNDGLSIASVMINGCYDFSLDNLVVSPYICAGIGGGLIEFFNTLHVKLAYQGKLGVSYSLSPKIGLFADGYYHKVKGNQFKNLSVQHVFELKDQPKTTSAIATLNIGYFGGEIGARFIF